MEKIQLSMQLEGARETSRELLKQIEDIAQGDTEGSTGMKSLDEDGAVESNDEPRRRSTVEEMEGKSDAMEIPRMRRRLAQTENELKRTRTKLLSAQSTLKVKIAKIWGHLKKKKGIGLSSQC